MIKAGLAPGLALHHLGATLFTLLFGWQFALIGLSLVLLAVTFHGGGGWHAFSANALVSVALPVLVSYGVLRFSERRLPDNFFVYIFVCAFFGAALAIAASALGVAGLLWVNEVYDARTLVRDYVRYIPLLMFPEAFVTGALMTTFVVYAPGWVHTFDDARYLDGK